MQRTKDQIIFTNKAKCRDCYRCIRSCKVKAIQMKDSQAFVDDLRCIKCGNCIKECPRNAKNYVLDIDKFEHFLENNERVAISIAPSFAGVFEEWEIKRLASMFRSLGCFYIGETAVGAYYSAQKSADYINENSEKSHITGSCPVVVNSIEKYHPELVDKLIPVVSPMIAHARIIKERYGYGTKFVFIGPCVAKKDEARRREHKGLVDAVLTFAELQQFLNDKEIDLHNFESSDFDEKPQSDSKLFPLLGGMLRTAKIDSNNISENVISVAGTDDLNEAFNLLKENKDSNLIVEPLFCKGGCINGAGINSPKNIFTRRKGIINYNNEKNKQPIYEVNHSGFHTRFYKDAFITEQEFSNLQIEKVLKSTGKNHPEDELNCGACGYDSCRKKAIAVLKGMAEHEMCIPYMRRMAEKRTDKVMEASPNGIIILNDKLEIINVNPAFKRMFQCSNKILGKPVSYLIDPDPFIKLSYSNEDNLEFSIEYKAYNLLCKQLLYKLKQDNQYVGIFINASKNNKSAEVIDELKKKTIDQAKLLLTHQINLAQNIAQMLGESTAEGEELVENLIRLNNEEIAE